MEDTNDSQDENLHQDNQEQKAIELDEQCLEISI